MPVKIIPAAERKRARNSILYGSAGTIVEWFDYGLYLYLVPVMAPLFFPSSDPIVSAMASLGVFAAGSIMRIAGGAFYGWIGDRRGRKRALVLSIMLMTFPLAMTAFLPTYATAGIWAPVLFTALRLAQGFSAGGEYSGTVVQLVEQAPPARRGFVAATAVFTSGIGILIASALVSALTTWLDPGAMSSYGWRIGYLVGGLLGLWTLVMRRKMAETTAFEEEVAHGQVPKRPLRFALRHLPGPVFVAALLAGYGGILYYVILGFVPTILDSISELQSDEALWVTTGMTALYAVATPLFGLLSDRWGRRRSLVWAALGFIVLSVPLFIVLTHDSLIPVMLAGCGLLLMLMLYTGPVVAAIGEQFPTAARYSALAVGYNLGSAVLGGTAPLIAAATINLFDTPVAPSFYLVACSIIAVPLLLKLRETKGNTLAEIDARHPRSTDQRQISSGP
ncbi:MAG: MFS transporter [Candidatus Nanopelagicales bacterium]|nr:MFS transporter [Candidatus Nanopelagicales bacterium]